MAPSMPPLDVLSPEFLRDQDDILDRARQSNPFASSVRGVEILGYRECVELLRDRRVQTDHMALVGRVGLSDPEVLAYKRRILVSKDLDADRERMRAVLHRAVSGRQMESARQDIRRLIENVFDALPVDEPIEFTEEVAALIPSRFFCRWVGLPLDDAPYLSQLSGAVLKIFRSDPSYADSIERAYGELFRYLDDHLDALQKNDDHGFLAHLRDEQRKGNVRPEEVRDWLVLALEASIDNTVQQISLLFGRLMESPDVWEQVRTRPELVPDVIEESLRLDSRVRAIYRFAAADIELDGSTIPTRTDIFFWIRAAHLDPREFDAPRRFDIHRKNRSRPLLFGGGAYSCLGQWMARTELQETLRVAMNRFPAMRLAGAPERRIDLFALSAGRLPIVLNG